MMFRPPSYNQCVAIARIARAGRPLQRSELEELAGAYATNLIRALEERGMLRQSLRGYELTDDGKHIAAELRGEVLATSPAH